MRLDAIKEGLYVKATNVVKRWHRLLVAGTALRARREGAEGVVWKAIPGHGGAWWVRQKDGKVAAYWYHELEPTDPPPPEESEFPKE